CLSYRILDSGPDGTQTTLTKNAIRGTYNHAQYLEGRREMMQWYADNISSLAEVSFLQIKTAG
ncbi:hypothetical protein, partial [Escherichia coli]|uniref:hypothetical protein n=1 Tax=Escherichia coli TaxID=562 RepID=UPI000AF63EB6